MTRNATLAASPAKLRNGSWGARVKSETVEIGDTVTITTRSGKSWDATVERVVWSGEGVSICATQSVDRRSTPARSTRRDRGTWTGCSCGSREDGYGDLMPSPRNCQSCRYDAD